MAQWLDEMLGALASGGQGNPQLQDLQEMPAPMTREQAANSVKGFSAGPIGGVMDFANIAQQVHAGARGGSGVDMTETPMTTDWIGERMGADIDSPEFIGSSMVGPDLFGKAAGAMGLAVTGIKKALGKGALEGIDDAEGLARQLENISEQAKVKSDYENDVSFVEMDTVDPNVKDRIGTTGQYRGAPAGIDKPQKLGKMRGELWRLLEEGGEGRDWYQQSAEMTNQLTGGRPNYKHLAAGANAITSRGAAVPANRVFGARGYNQAITGRPVDAGRFPTAQGEAIEQLASGDTYFGGPKETPFYEGLTIDERAQGIRPTNDLWMARAFGFKRPDGSEWGEGLGKAQHRFMDKELNHIVQKANEAELGGFTDWSPERVQAAIWVAKKAEMEGTTVAKAAEDFSHGMQDLTGNVRYEVYPSKSLEHMQGFGNTDAYAEIAEQLTNDSAGRNIISLETGALTMPSDRGYGIYEGATSPSMSARPIMAPSTGSSAIDPASMDLAKGIGAGHGLALGQDTVGVTSFRPAKSAAERNIARVPGDGSKEGLQALEAQLLEEFGGDAFPLHTPDGYEVAYMGDDGKAFTKGMKKIAGKDVELGRNSGGLVGNTNWDDPGYKPSEWMREIDEANLGPAEARLERGTVQLATLMNETDKALEAAGVGNRDAILTKTRELLESGGFAAVRQAVKDKIIPAVVLTTLGGGVAGNMMNEEQPGGVM